ncbi:MAG: HD domain-containing protein, partial [candidate division NC10 bacterium]
MGEAGAHAGQQRASGEAYITHPSAAALTLARMKLPLNMIIAGLLHVVPEDTQRTLGEIEERFGSDVAKLVSGITKLSPIKY